MVFVLRDAAFKFRAGTFSCMYSF